MASRLLALTTLAASLLFAQGEARADVSSWMSVSAGESWLSRHSATRRFETMELGLGVGSPPSRSVIVGFMVKSLTLFDGGTDISLNVRGATVIGFVGAGGIGQELYTVISFNYYQEISAILVLIILAVSLIDLASEWVRTRAIGAVA